MLNISHILPIVFVLSLLMDNTSCQMRPRLLPRQTDKLLEDVMAKQQNEQELLQQQEAAAFDQQNAVPVVVKDVSFKSNNFAERARSPGRLEIVTLCPAAKLLHEYRLKQLNGSEQQHSLNKTVSENSPPSAPAHTPPTEHNAGKPESWQQELQKVVQQIFVAQAQVQLEASQIERAQAIAVEAQQALEESAKNVRIITAALHAAQEKLAAAALRAQTAQLQLAAHDQLLFTARQRVDALSAQMVGLQAQEGMVESKPPVDLPALLAKLKQPLPETQKPTPVPSILGQNSLAGGSKSQTSDGSGNVKRRMSVEKRSHPERKTITKGDLKDLVKFILDKNPDRGESVSKDNNQEVNIQTKNSKVDENLKKAVDQKYFSQFLDNIKNIELKGKRHHLKVPKIENHILNLYESILKPSDVERPRKVSSMIKKSSGKSRAITRSDELPIAQNPGKPTAFANIEQLDSDVGKRQPAFYYESYPLEENSYQRD